MKKSQELEVKLAAREGIILGMHAALETMRQERDKAQADLAAARAMLAAPCGDCETLQKRVMELESELAMGNHLYARLTDTCRELEHQLAEAAIRATEMKKPYPRDLLKQGFRECGIDVTFVEEPKQ